MAGRPSARQVPAPAAGFKVQARCGDCRKRDAKNLGVTKNKFTFKGEELEGRKPEKCRTQSQRIAEEDGKARQRKTLQLLWKCKRPDIYIYT
ncbi:hypothetical protein E2C01_069329 [Portunus trituberculatus]|uniref:Uncharacterized protein n=1 Tax=Portunus trituberculatus TaxID=210409 RepID=A0A5B7HZ18_PORTR|nr:hypothetical protein [Portunus trituberculatus]